MYHFVLSIRNGASGNLVPNGDRCHTRCGELFGSKERRHVLNILLDVLFGSSEKGWVLRNVVDSLVLKSTQDRLHWTKVRVAPTR